MNPPSLYIHPDYAEHSRIVEATTLHIQPRNGNDYSTSARRHIREKIATNVWQGLNPLTGVR